MNTQLKAKLNNMNMQSVCQVKYAKKINKIEMELFKLKKGGIFSISSILFL